MLTRMITRNGIFSKSRYALRVESVLGKSKQPLAVYVYTQKCLRHSIPPDTTLRRFFNYFEACPKYTAFIVNRDDLNNTFDNYGAKHGQKRVFRGNGITPSNPSVQELSLTELMKFIIYLSEKKMVKRSDDFKSLIKTLDSACCRKIVSLTVEEALRMNYCWLCLMGTEVKFLKLFNLLLDHYEGSLREKVLPLPVVVLMLFYSGIARKYPKAKEVVAHGLKYMGYDRKNISNLSTLELFIIAEVAFKTGSKIINPVLIEHIVETVNKNVPGFVKDPELFVVAIKTMRHNKYQNWNLLKKIDRCLTNDASILKEYSLAVNTHLLALYADALYGNQVFLYYVIDSAISKMSEYDAYNPYNEIGRGRAKDVARLVWATSYLGFKFEQVVFEKTVMPVIMEKFVGGVYSRSLNTLIDTALSLWIMGYKPLDLLPAVFSMKTRKHLFDMKRIRYDARLQLLSTCVSIETPETMKDDCIEKFPPLEIYDPGEDVILKRRPALKRVLQDVRALAFKFDSFKVTCQNSLPYLNIPGIILSNSNNQPRAAVHIEVLDDTNCLHETNTPTGLMLLKLRLLRKLGHKVILVNYDDYESNQPILMLQIEDEIMEIKQLRT